MKEIGEMKLVGMDGSAFVTRVKFALKLKSFDYEYHEDDLRYKSELLLKSNPAFQRVSVLLHGNQPLMSESLAILEYLDEIKPDVHPLLPSNPSERVQCRIMAYPFDTLCYPWMKEFMVCRDNEGSEELKSLMIGACGMLEEAFGMFSKGKPYFGGDNTGYPDIVVGAFLGWMEFYGKVFNFHMLTEARNPKLMEWGKLMWSNEVARSVIPSHETHMKFLNMLESSLPPLTC